MSDTARDRAARLLKKQSSRVSSNSDIYKTSQSKFHGSMSTISFADEQHEDRLPVSLENTYQIEPQRKFPSNTVQNVIRDTLEGYLKNEKYDPELSKHLTKTISEVIKSRVKELNLPRYKLISIVHIGQPTDQGLRIGSRCLWDQTNDSYSTYEYRTGTIFAVGVVYAVYSE